MRNHGFVGRLSTTGALAIAWSSQLCFFTLGTPLAAQVLLPASPRPGVPRLLHESDILFRGPVDPQANPSGLTGGIASRVPESSAELKVSVDELRHPLTRKARSALATVLGYAERGEHEKAIATLEQAMAKIRELRPYAHQILGVEYMRVGRAPEAIAELAEAVDLFPHDAAAHSNLAVSLCMTGQMNRAEQEARLALYLDPLAHSAQVLLSDIEETKARHAAR
jgi:tetratricopeptide (TPR) repeat protein